MLSTHEEIAAQNLRDLAKAPFARSASVGALAGATAYHYEDLIVEALVTRMIIAVLDGEVTQTNALASQVRPLMAKQQTAIRPLFYWAWCQANGTAKMHGLEFEEAEDWYRWGKESATANRFDSGRRASLAGLGRVYSRQGKLSQAIEVLTQLAQDSNVADRSSCVVQGHLAEMFEHQGHFDQALEHRLAAQDPGFDVGDRERAVAKTAEADLLAKMTRTQAASECLLNARLLVDRIPSKSRRAELAIVEARICLQQGDPTSAEDLALEAVHLFSELSRSHDEMLARGLVAMIYMEAGRIPEALEVLADERVALMGPWFGAQAATLRAEAHRHNKDWELVVEQQDQLQRHEQVLRRDLTALYSLLKRYQQGKALRRQRELLSRTNDDLEIVQREKDELISIVAHDLQSPLTSLDLTFELIVRDQSTARSRHRALTAKSTINRIQGMVNQLTALNELESGAVDLSFEYLSLDEAVQRVVAEFEPTAKSKNIALQYHDNIDVHAPHFVRADSAKLQQILANLISNAIKYSSADTTVRVDVVTPPPADSRRPDEAETVHVVVRDEGLGLNPSDLSELFAKYARLSSRPTGGETSSGVGLYIAQSFAQAMGGSITAKSKGKGCGSSFAFSIPLVSLTGNKPQAVETTTPHSFGTMNHDDGEG